MYRRSKVHGIKLEYTEAFFQFLREGFFYIFEYVGRIFMETKERPLYFVESSSIKPRRVLLSQSKFTERRKI